MLVPLLATALSTVLVRESGPRRAAALGEPVLVVPVPTRGSARRRRGEDPVAALVRDAVASLGAGGPVFAPVLRHTRPVADQARLGRARRWANLAGAIAVSPSRAALVRGRVCVLADDVVTTGSTLAEAARALRAAGAADVLAVAVGATP
ncbi:hypothetical protein JQN72_17240 [Phycicoccus sp. CSK15P-2]|nr:hypothetical protein [Phycicoccus sp. CSK15P-2]